MHIQKQMLNLYNIKHFPVELDSIFQQRLITDLKILNYLDLRMILMLRLTVLFGLSVIILSATIQKTTNGPHGMKDRIFGLLFSLKLMAVIWFGQPTPILVMFSHLTVQQTD